MNPGTSKVGLRVSGLGFGVRVLPTNARHGRKLGSLHCTHTARHGWGGGVTSYPFKVGWDVWSLALNPKPQTPRL